MDDLYREAGLDSVYPLTRAEIGALPLTAVERELQDAILAEPGADASAPPSPARAPRPRRRWGFAGGAGLAATALAALFLLIGSGAGTDQIEPAFAAKLVRVAKTSPLVLLKEPGWHVACDITVGHGRGEMHFLRSSGRFGRERETAELRWLSGRGAIRLRRRFERNAAGLVLMAPAVGRLSRDKVLQIHTGGSPRHRLFTAFWQERGRGLLFRSAARDLTAFDHRLAALHRVGPNAWLTALPEELTRPGGPLSE